MTLLINKFKYEKLTRDESSGKRLYATPQGHKVPSVTTVLDKTKPEESRIALANWRKAVGEKKAQEITTEAANRGTRMHKFLEDYVKCGDQKYPCTFQNYMRVLLTVWVYTMVTKVSWTLNRLTSPRN